MDIKNYLPYNKDEKYEDEEYESEEERREIEEERECGYFFDDFEKYGSYEDYEEYKKNYREFKNSANSFTKGLYSILTNKELSPAEKKLLIFLHTIDKKDGGIICTINMIMGHTGLKKSSAYKSINLLEKKGYVQRIKKGDINDKFFVLKTLKEFENTDKWLKIYDKLWWYPIFNYADVLVYSYYLFVGKILGYKKGIKISTSHVAEKLGLVKSTISITNKKLKELGIISITKDNRIKILIDFSSMQPEEEKEWFKKIERIKNKLQASK